MIIRATQKNRISYAVFCLKKKKNILKSGVASGQPSVEKGHNPELNHVSRTSGSCSNFVDAHFEHFSGASRATIISLQFPQCQAGMRWPHQSCRDSVQSRMFLIQLKYSSRLLSGTI